MDKYGLIGRDIGYSFSKNFFTSKFSKENRSDTYVNFDLESIDAFKEIIESNDNLKGLNVTIPYKESVISLLDKLDDEAQNIGAVNTIKILPNGKLIGYNTDHYGFAKSLTDFFPLKNKTALILGTGGASKAVAFTLKKMGFEYQYVSRSKTKTTITYSDLDRNTISKYYLIINCTPCGTFPNVQEFPNIPYQFLTSDHLLFDLIYNPSETAFLSMGHEKGARVTNGLKMLEYQAKKAWSIWKS